MDDKEVVETEKEPTIKELLEHQKKLDANISGSVYEKKAEASEKKNEPTKEGKIGGSASKSSPSPWAPQA